MNKHLIISGLLLLAGSLSLNAQVLYNNGKIHVGGTTTTNALYIGGSMHVVGAGSITQTGKTVLTGDFVNDVTSGNVFGATRTGTFEFRGSDVQEIRGTANKATGFIAFPDNLIINNSHTSHLNTIVKITPTMSATIKNLSFTRGRLVLDSNSGTNGGQRVSVIAHLLAETGGAITYKHEQASKVNEGVVQVNLNLGDNWSTGRMAGFSPPFKHMYADYFFFNFLSRPTGSGFFSGSKDVWIHEPKTKLPAGTGYVLGQGLVPWDSSYYIETLNPSYSTAVRSEAAQTDYAFARTLVPTSLSSFVNAAFTDEYTGEELNTGNVAVTLSNLDYNYLGNPYTVPLDLTELVDDQAVPTLSTATWGAAASTLARRFYVLSAGTGTYLPNKEFAFTVSYLTAQRVGGTMTAPYHIAPMQMFAVQTTSSAQPSFTIPATKRTHGVAQFLRSDSNPVIDELLIETQDGQTGGFDRLCIVFRNNATLASTDPYDAGKLFNRTGGVNQIYTRSSDNKELTTNVVPPSTSKLTMYFEPSNQVQEVVLKADRIQSISSVVNVVLEDLQTGNVVDLKRSPSYRFYSSPNDRTDRFVLYFDSNSPVGTGTLRAGSLFHANYESGSVGVYGVKDSHIGKTAFIYDMLGNLLHQQTITEAPSFRIEKLLSKGVYIVRLTGEASVAKFAVK